MSFLSSLRPGFKRSESSLWAGTLRQRGFPVWILIAGSILGLSWPAPGTTKDAWTVIRIQMDEYRFTPNRIILEEGKPVRIEIENQGNEEHEFRSSFLKGSLIVVEGKGVQVQGTDFHSVIVLAGSVASIKWLNPPRGEYSFECRIPSHHGMDGTIVVKVAD